MTRKKKTYGSSDTAWNRVSEEPVLNRVYKRGDDGLFHISSWKAIPVDDDVQSQCRSDPSGLLKTDWKQFKGQRLGIVVSGYDGVLRKTSNPLKSGDVAEAMLALGLVPGDVDTVLGVSIDMCCSLGAFPETLRRNTVVLHDSRGYGKALSYPPSFEKNWLRWRDDLDGTQTRDDGGIQCAELPGLGITATGVERSGDRIGNAQRTNSSTNTGRGKIETPEPLRFERRAMAAFSAGSPYDMFSTSGGRVDAPVVTVAVNLPDIGEVRLRQARRYAMTAACLSLLWGNVCLGLNDILDGKSAWSPDAVAKAVCSLTDGAATVRAPDLVGGDSALCYAALAHWCCGMLASDDTMGRRFEQNMRAIRVADQMLRSVINEKNQTICESIFEKPDDTETKSERQARILTGRVPVYMLIPGFRHTDGTTICRWGITGYGCGRTLEVGYKKTDTAVRSMMRRLGYTEVMDAYNRGVPMEDLLRRLA